MSGIFRKDFSGHFSHKKEEKKSGDKIREKIRRPKDKNPRKIRSAKSDPNNSSRVIRFSGCCSAHACKHRNPSRRSER